jgi:hypothetical protein
MRLISQRPNARPRCAGGAAVLFAAALLTSPSPSLAAEGQPATSLGKLGPRAKKSARTRCRRDADCEVCPRACRGCAPCKTTWRRVCNRKQAALLRKRQQAGGCPKLKCKRCSGRGVRLGNFAFCQRGVCRLRHFATPPPKRPSSKDRACKRDAQCVLMPLASPCGCAPCGHVWRRAVNRGYYRRWKGKWAARRCAQRACPACARVPYGRSASCVAGQCTVRP